MSRRHDPTRARRHWVYTRPELCKLSGVSDSTISNWIGHGLTPIDNHRPQLFAGFEVRRFLTNLRWPHGRQPAKGQLFCHFCFQYRSLSADSINSLPDEVGRFTMRGYCTECDSMLQAIVPQRTVSEIYRASFNTAGDSSDVNVGPTSERTAKSNPSIPPETCNSNQRWLFYYRRYLEEHEEWEADTVDEHLRSLARISAIFGHSPFEAISIDDVIKLKDKLREMRVDSDEGDLSHSTVAHILWHGGAFFRWFVKRPDVKIDPDLPGYFNLSRREKGAESSAVKGTSLTFDMVVCIFAAMPASNPVEIRNRAIIAMFATTGIRVAALSTLRGKHVNIDTRWINQDPREVDTKFGKHIRTYCFDLGHGFLDAIREWWRWRTNNGFGDNGAFFLPDRYLQPNSIGLGFKPASEGPAQCWKSDDPVQQIIKNATRLAGFDPAAIASHDFRKVIHPFLARRGGMTVAEEVALQLNFGQTPTEIIRKHYALMSEQEREAILGELCRRALSDHSELELYLAFQRGELTEADPDFERARDIFRRHAPSSDR